MSDAIEPFLQLRRVTFGDADPRGTLYFASVARYCMDAVEAWFTERLDSDWIQLSNERQIGAPVVHSEFDFHKAARWGESLRLRVLVSKCGRSSINLLVQGHAELERSLCFECRFICVFINTATTRPVEIPGDLRLLIEREATISADVQ
jgi:acyl-CoA thioesterase FadM